MPRQNPSRRIYLGLVLVLILLMVASVFFPAMKGLPDPSADLSRSELLLITIGVGLVAYGGLGYLGYRISLGLGFADIWDPSVSNHDRFVAPLKVGLLLGCLMVAGDAIFSRLHTLGPLPHPAFPVSILASATAGVGEEMIFRLFFIPVWMWVLSRPFRGRHLDVLFWVVAVMSALAFSAAHLPAAPLLLGVASVSDIPTAMMVEIFLLNSAVALPAAYYLRKSGFLAAAGIHFWNNVVWHVVWGAFSGAGG